MSDIAFSLYTSEDVISLDIKDGIGGVHGSLVLRSLSDQAFLGSEGDEGRSGEVSLLIGNWPHLV